METPPLHKAKYPAKQAWQNLLQADEIEDYEQAFMKGYEEDAQKTFEEGS